VVWLRQPTSGLAEAAAYYDDPLLLAAQRYYARESGL